MAKIGRGSMALENYVHGNCAALLIGGTIDAVLDRAKQLASQADHDD